MIMSAGMLISLRGVKGVQEETMLFSGHYKIMVSLQVALEEIIKNQSSLAILSGIFNESNKA